MELMSLETPKLPNFRLLRGRMAPRAFLGFGGRLLGVSGFLMSGFPVSSSSRCEGRTADVAKLSISNVIGWSL